MTGTEMSRAELARGMEQMLVRMQDEMVADLRRHGLTWRREVILFRLEEHGGRTYRMLEAYGEMEVLDSAFLEEWIQQNGGYDA